jgi:branched-chain amino acid transport system permease protein
VSSILNAEFWEFVGVVAGIYTIFALGVQVQFGFTGLLNFGHVAFMAIGAYTMAILVVKRGFDMWLAAGIAIAVAVLFGLLIGLPALRLRADYLAITTIAFGEIVRYVALNEDRLTGGAQGTINLAGAGKAPSYSVQWDAFQGHVQGWLEALVGGRATRDLTMLVIVWAVALALIVVLQVLVHSPWGRVLRSIREDEDAAASLGKAVFLYKLQSLALGAVLGALAGLFYAWQFTFFSPDDFAPLVTFFAWTIVILGGLGRNWAVPVGALVFGIVFAGTRFFDFRPFTYFDSAERAYLRLIVIGLILIGLMVFRPQGLFGRRREMVLE